MPRIESLRLERRAILAAFFFASLSLTAAALLSPAVPLWVAGLPLLAAVALGREAQWPRVVLSLGHLICPALIAAWGLHGVGAPAVLVWPAVAAAALLLALLMGFAGVVIVSVLLLFVPVFPANPLLALADALPGAGQLATLFAAAVLLFAEMLDRAPLRAALVAVVCFAILLQSQGPNAPERGDAESKTAQWREMATPAAITREGRWRAIAEAAAPGDLVVLGENQFAADDVPAHALWCRIVAEGGFVAILGVRGADGRSLLYRYDDAGCAAGVGAFHAARFGIPGLTGTWGAMDPPPGASAGGGAGWLLCYEAFLPWAWAPVLEEDDAASRPVIVLSNDRALAPVPFHVVRRKVAGAMAGRAGRAVLFAETGRTWLLLPAEAGMEEEL